MGHCCSRIDALRIQAGGKVLVDGVSLHLHCGEVLGIIGPNGGGKSTLLRALAGELEFSGQIEFLAPDGSKLARPQIGYVPQSLRFGADSPLTVLELFAITLSHRPLWLGISKSLAETAKQRLQEVEALDLLNRRLGVLSGGELQRVLLALALEPLPNLLLLDEPISGMDANGRTRFYQLVDRIRRTHDLAVLMVSHDFAEMSRFADRLLLLDQTPLAIGTPKQVFASSAFQSRFGLEIPQ